jgi:hypothetical protein
MATDLEAIAALDAKRGIGYSEVGVEIISTALGSSLQLGRQCPTQTCEYCIM